MKCFSIFLFLSLVVGCVDDSPRREDVIPDLKAGECIQFTSDSFYANCSGTVIDYEPFRYVRSSQPEPPVFYKVHFVCITDHILTAQGEANIPRTQLKECAK